MTSNVLCGITPLNSLRLLLRLFNIDCHSLSLIFVVDFLQRHRCFAMICWNATTLNRWTCSVLTMIIKTQRFVRHYISHIYKEQWNLIRTIHPWQKKMYVLHNDIKEFDTAWTKAVRRRVLDIPNYTHYWLLFCWLEMYHLFVMCVSKLQKLHCTQTDTSLVRLAIWRLFVTVLMCLSVSFLSKF